MPATPTSVRKDVDALIKGLERQGVQVETRGKGVQKLVFPDGKWTLIHSSPSDVNVLHNIRRRVAKSGLQWPLEDTKALKAAIKAAKRDAPPEEPFVPPTGPIEHLVVPNSVKSYGGARPSNRPVGYVRGALIAIGNPPTFWTSEVSEVLNGAPGFRGIKGGSNQRVQQILDWLGYRVVEVKPNRNGHSYRWVLDPTADRAAQETLPIIHINRGEETHDDTVEPQTEAVGTEASEVVAEGAGVPEAVQPDAPADDASDAGPDAAPVAIEPAVADEVEPETPEPLAEDAPEPALPAAELHLDRELGETHRFPAAVPAPAAVPEESDIHAALALLDDAGSWSVDLTVMGKDGKRLAKMLHRLGLNGELRVWRR